MLGIKYLKADPTQYVLHFENGRVAHAGAGVAFFYYQPISSIAVVPVGSADVPFIFNEFTADYQPVTVQGQLTYRVSNPKLVASLLNYTVEGGENKYVTDDPDKLPQRLVNLAQVLTRSEVSGRRLREALGASDAIALAVQAKLGTSEALGALGVEVLTFSILAIKPTPDMSRALEADAREGLLKQADNAIYDRRNSAVEQERMIKENELNTEIAVEEKKRQIRETKVEADLAVEAKEQQIREQAINGKIKLEEERKKLVAAQVENARTEADVQSYASEAALRPLKDLSGDVLQLLSTQTAEPRLMVSMAMREIAKNAGKIGQLNITPDLLGSLMEK
jgi:SPFH domain / Band 7 family